MLAVRSLDAVSNDCQITLTGRVARGGSLSAPARFVVRASTQTVTIRRFVSANFVEIVEKPATAYLPNEGALGSQTGELRLGAPASPRNCSPKQNLAK
jgi:hypothetical protein